MDHRRCRCIITAVCYDSGCPVLYFLKEVNIGITKISDLDGVKLVSLHLPMNTKVAWLTAPTLFVAKHWYIPASRFVFNVIVIEPFPSAMSLSAIGNGLPFLYHVITGLGLPVATHDSDKFTSIRVSFRRSGTDMNFGGATKERNGLMAIFGSVFNHLMTATG